MNNVSALNELQIKSAQNPEQNQTTSETKLEAAESPRHHVDYYIVVVDLSTAKWLHYITLSPYFATLEQAEEFQAEAKAHHSDCIIWQSTHYFCSENDRDRQKLLAKIVSDASPNSTVRAYHKTEKIKQINNKTSSLSLIVHGDNNQLSIDSRDIAKEFGRQHKNVLQTLDNLLADGTVSRLESKPRNYKKLGREYRCFELSEADFLKAMPFIGGRKSRDGQKRLVDEFMRVRKQLARQSKEREKLACQIARLSGKDSRAILTDEIKKFVSYAKERGSNNPERYYSIITNAVHNALVMLEPKVIQVRELLTTIELSRLATIELTVALALTEGMNAGLPYKEIYQMVKNALIGFASERTQILGG